MNVPARKPKEPQVARATLDDLLAIPEEERRHELIEGMLCPKEAASPRHGRAQRRIAAFVDPFDQPPAGDAPGGWWIVTEVEVYFDAKNTLRPDVTGWRRSRVPEFPEDTPVRIRPDWVCEILSTNRGNDLVKKKRVYHRHEIPYYWIVDPANQLFHIYRWTSEGYLEILVAEPGEIVSPEPFEVMPLQVGRLFRDEPKRSEEESKDEPSTSD